ncbi:MAG TPA: helix-turn-helix domain-containing protein [Bacillota bacterium]
MIPIPNQDLLRSYIDQYSLDALFESDMTSHMSLFYYPKGELICEGSAKLHYMFFLVAGKLKTFTMLDNGKSLLLRFSRPLSVLGDLEFLSRFPVRCNVEAQMDSYLIGIKFDDLYQYAYNDPTFLRFLINNLSFKLYTVSNSATLNQLYPLENRFASYLLSVSVYVCEAENGESRVEEIKTPKLTEIAMMLGTSYRHLNRVIGQFRRDGIISQKKGSLTVLDLSRLKILAKENIYE